MNHEHLMFSIAIIFLTVGLLALCYAVSCLRGEVQRVGQVAAKGSRTPPHSREPLPGEGDSTANVIYGHAYTDPGKSWYFVDRYACAPWPSSERSVLVFSSINGVNWFDVKTGKAPSAQIGYELEEAFVRDRDANALPNLIRGEA